MGRNTKSSKAKGKKQEPLVCFVDTRDESGWKGSRKMSRSAFSKMVQRDKLMCFNFNWEWMIIHQKEPRPETADNVWWPELNVQPGHLFDMEKEIFVFKPNEAFDEIKHEILKGIKDEDEKRKELGIKLIAEEEEVKKKETDDKKVREGEELKSKEIDDKKERKEEMSGEVEEVQLVEYRDLRKEISSMKKAAMRKMDRQSFLKMVRDENLICFNFSAYLLFCPEGFSRKEVQDGTTPYVWWPRLKDVEIEDVFWEQEIFVDQPTDRHSVLMQLLAKTYDEALKLMMILARQSNKEQVVAFEEEDEQWKHIISTKGKSVTTKQLIIKVMETMVKRTDLQRVESNLQRVESNLQQVESNLQSKIVSLEEHVSRIAERSCRANFGALIISQLHSGCELLQPVARVVLPYQPKDALEKLAVLCGKLGKNGSSDMKVRATPNSVEIDIVVHIRCSQHRNVLQISTSTTHSKRVHGKFSHIAIAEVTRSVSLCNAPSKYSHPQKLEISPSSKLLFKLIQLERDVHSVLEHFGITLDEIAGACVISPSFQELFKCEELLGKVLGTVKGGLENLSQLYEVNRLWLMDL